MADATKTIERATPPGGHVWLSPADLVARWRDARSEKTLRNWRSARIGPPWHDFGAGALYRLDEIEEWERQNSTRMNPTR